MTDTPAPKKNPRDAAIGSVSRLLENATRTAHKARGFAPNVDESLRNAVDWSRQALLLLQALPAEATPVRKRAPKKGPDAFTPGKIYEIKEGQRTRYLKILKTADPSACDFARYMEPLDDKSGVFTILDGTIEKPLQIAFADLKGEVVIPG